MNCISVYKNNNVLRFRGGLTSKIKDEIQSVNCRKVEQYFEDKNIDANFSDDKFVAWGSLKTLQLLEKLNGKYNFKFQYPNAIFVRDFQTINAEDKSQMAFSTIFPIKTRKNSDETIPARTILFNLNNFARGLDNIDSEVDVLFEKKYKPTNYFLDVFFHEFAHLMHVGNIANKNKMNLLFAELGNLKDKNQRKVFQDNFGEKLATICLYAKENPLEAVACDISKRLTACVNRDTANYNYDAFEKSPYIDKNPLTRLLLCCYTKENIPLDEILRRFWDGNFNFH